ncbi:MAG TPA: hypothetical protein PLU37_13970 [Chitinophagaceae bacterium]|nr:hypothetical protein [Chitinophagaceae bacterium]
MIEVADQKPIFWARDEVGVGIVIRKIMKNQWNAPANKSLKFRVSPGVYATLFI